MADAQHIPDGELIVAKVGSNSITSVLSDGTYSVDISRVKELVQGVVDARSKNYRVIIVTSGAVAAGMRKEHLVKRPGNQENIRLSSLSAIGQTQLMSMYSDAFEKYGITVAQGLPRQDDFRSDTTSEHIKQTLNDLLDLGVVPIINENDFTSDAEMRFGDNDMVASLIGILCEAKHVILLTVEDGIMTGNPNTQTDVELIENITELTPEMFDDRQELSAAGSGGINSKLYAGDLCSHSGINLHISHVNNSSNLIDIINSKIRCSHFVAIDNVYIPIRQACEFIKELKEHRDNPFFRFEDFLK